MYSIFSYYTLLLLIIIFYLYLFFICSKDVPKKMKPYLLSFIILGILKNIYIIILGLSNKGFNIYLSKAFVFLDIIYIPAIIISLFYIFWRSDNLKYIKVIKSVCAFLIIYIILLVFFPAKLDISKVFGYFISFKNIIIIKAIISMIYVLFMIYFIYCRFNKTTDSKGMNLLIIWLVIAILDNLCGLVVRNYLPYTLVSEAILICIACYGVRKFK
ncbi:MAG: hypothetical protein ACRC57_03180 [Sarcina sp.]